MAILKIYKNTLNDLIHNLDPESPPRLINKRFYNALRSRGGSTNFPKKDCLNKDVLVLNKSSKLAT